MKKSIFSLMAAAVITSVVGNSAQAEEITVKKGDTLWDLANNYEVTVNDVKNWNGLTTDLIFAGQPLSIHPEIEYIVVEGDTLGAIADNYNVTIDHIIELNSLGSDLILPNQKLVLIPSLVEQQLKNSSIVEVGSTSNQETANVVDNTTTEPVEAPQVQTETVTPTEPSVQSEPVPPTGPVEETTASTEEVIQVTATAYTASCEGCSGVTATGIDLNQNPNQKVIAVDPNVIPLGTKVYVEGYGEAIAGDTGGAIKGNKIDLYMPHHSDAVSWGRQTVNVTILE
jgi:3D (Asp-Asp-Asp) domain-containing protein/LysM repeat protein